ncbi:EAL domain-containing protein [Clostridium sp. DJ247]|uniref:EAL domain-containing protein n=1 Tax=Clostridium sp. DJ247 TaxID=2726188 RepID=UPI0016267A73|nr:EAL domain-containing protein [Clostridium sp. DJ247]MBC2582322.1 EAL domain-containing protein [Clostridium sp. DJ247]
MLIKKKLPLIIIFLVSVPLMLLSILIYYHTSTTLINNSKNNIEQITKVESHALISLINQQKREVEISTQRASVINILKSRQQDNKDSFLSLPQILKEDELLRSRTGNLIELQNSFIVDLNGIIVSDSESEGKGINVKHKQYFKKALLGQLAISSTLLSEVNSKLVIVIAAPVRDEDGNIIGVFGNSIHAEYFENFTSKVKIGSTGYAYIVDNEGLVLAHPNKNKIGKPVENSKIKDVAKNASNLGKLNIHLGENDIYMDTYNYNNKDRFVGINIIPGVNWTLAVTRDIDEIKAVARNQLYIIIGITIFMILISIKISINAARSITNPIEKLIGTMNKAARGDLNSICEHESNDELGQLSDNFNTMIEKLNLSYEELSAVYEELTATDEELRAQYDELLQSQEALTLSEERYIQVLNGINDAIWEWDMNKYKFFISDKFYDITGYNIKDISIRKLLKVALLPEDQRIFFKDIRHHIKMENSYYRSEFKILTNSGEIKWILNRGKLVRDSNGEPLKFFGAMSDITKTRIAQEKIKQLAYYDPLTGLPNRTNFIQQLDEELKVCKKSNNKAAALLFIDVDDFKKVNDSLGHDVGDKLLKSVSDKLVSLVDTNDVVCRFGGDEFLILKKDVSDKEEVRHFVRNLLKEFETRFELDEKQMFITLSIGISMLPCDGEHKNIILKNSDTAMYKAKDKGKNTYQFYTADMSEGLIRSMVVEKVLRTAVNNNEIYLQYQPQIELKTGRVIGTEALVRLKSDELGFISPKEFIPIAEKTGLIISIGQWIMRTACSQNIAWLNKYSKTTRISINVSSIQINELDFVETVKRCILEAGISPELVEIEITESILMESLEANVKILNELRNFGVRIALDDFGTGYSSLNYLRSIPINTLKIDKSFIDDICFNTTQDSIVDGIIQVAHKMGIEVVAEGVETQEQLEVLKKKQCDIIQGYVFSKPLMPNDIDSMLESTL